MTTTSMRTERSSSRQAWAEVDLSAIVANLTEMRRVAGDGPLMMAVVKADAYGHGAVEVSRAVLAAGVADRLGVALPSEAAELREAGIDAPILVLIDPGTDARELDICLEAEAAVTIASRATLDALIGRIQMRQTPPMSGIMDGEIPRVHVKVDTGMHRSGFSPAEVLEMLSGPMQRAGIVVEGIFTHLACADEMDTAPTENQLRTFGALLTELDRRRLRPPFAHAANSAGAACYPEARLDMLRVGIAMYGLRPGVATDGLLDLRPALSLRAVVTRVHTVPAGDGVSYGLDWVAPEDTQVATVAAGYGDGYHRALSGKASAVCRGQKVRQVGRVCMDQMMFALPPSSGISVGDVMTLIGAEDGASVTADELAGLAGTINYEVVTGLMARLPREYLR